MHIRTVVQDRFWRRLDNCVKVQGEAACADLIDDILLFHCLYVMKFGAWVTDQRKHGGNHGKDRQKSGVLKGAKGIPGTEALNLLLRQMWRTNCFWPSCLRLKAKLHRKLWVVRGHFVLA